MASGGLGALCCVLPLAVILAVAGLIVALWQRLAMRGFHTAIDMDGATCLVADDGRLVFRRHSLRNGLYLAILGLALAGLVALAGSTASGLAQQTTTLGEAWEGLTLEMGAGALIAAAIVVLVRSLGRGSASFDTRAGVVRVGRGRSARETPFSDISHIDAGLSMRHDFEDQKLGVYDIDLVLKDGERLTLGTVSGKSEKVRERADRVAHLAAEATGAPLGMGRID
jgi:hypothetical protein